jgi:hypothetical protein
MAKTKTGYVPPKGKPSGSGRETHGLKNALAVNDLETDNELAEKYTDGEDEPSANVSLRHVNRNVNKGHENNNNSLKA